MPLLVTYHPLFHNLRRIIRKYFIYLYAKEQAEQFFTTAPFVSFRSGFSLRNHLVPARVYPLLKQKWSSSRGKVGAKPASTEKKQTLFEALSLKRFTKLSIISIMRASVLFTFHLVRFVTYSMLRQLLIGFVWDGITIMLPYGSIERWCSQNKTTSIKIS